MSMYNPFNDVLTARQVLAEAAIDAAVLPIRTERLAVGMEATEDYIRTCAIAVAYLKLKLLNMQYVNTPPHFVVKSRNRWIMTFKVHDARHALGQDGELRSVEVAHEPKALHAMLVEFEAKP